MKMFVAISMVVLGMGIASGNAAEAKANWDQYCAKCHGKTGKGDTKMGVKLSVRDLTSAKVQSSFTDEQAFNSIKNGVKEDGKEKMAPYADKLSDEEIKALVAYIRSMK